MQIDGQLLADLGDQPILHFYQWEGDAATYGHFIKPADFLDLDRAGGLDLARRPTGGGIVFHSYDLAFSVLVPTAHPAFSLNTLERYRWVNQRVIEAILPYLDRAPELLPHDPTPASPAAGSFCMAKPTIYDIVVDGRKVGGAAQRKTRSGFLHQGTISLIPPDLEKLASVLLPGTGVLEAMHSTLFALLPEGTDLEAARGDLRHSLLKAISLS
jgi:lipoate---protein ligase